MKSCCIFALMFIPAWATAQESKPDTTRERFETLARKAADFARKGDYARTIGLREEALKINPKHLDQRRFLIDDYLRLLAKNTVPELKPEEHTLDNPQYKGFLTERLSMWQACYGHYKKLVLTGDIDLAEAVRRTHIMLDYPPYELLKAFPKEAEAIRLNFLREVFPVIGEIPSSSPHASTQLSEWEQWRDLSMIAVRRFDLGQVTRANLDLLADLITKSMPDKTPLSSAMYFFLQQRPDELGRAVPGIFTEEDYLAFLERLKKSERKTAQMYGRYGWVYYHWLKPRARGVLPGADVLAEAEALHKVFPRDNNYVYVGMSDLRFYLDKELNPHKYPAPKFEPQPVLKKPERSTGALSYLPLGINVKTLAGETVPFKGRRWENYHGWGSLNHMTPCEDGLDVFWNNGAVAFMKEKGLLEEIVVDPKLIVDDVKWDGLRVWIATRKEGLWVVSPGGKILARIGAREGLPPCERRIMLLPLATGKVCAVGASGEHGQAWCAMVTQPESGPAKVNVFHRAGRVWASEDEGKEEAFSKDPAITFTPQWMHQYQRGAGKEPLILVGRNAATHAGRRIPLAINPDTLEVGIADFETHFADRRISDAYFSLDGKLLEAGDFGTYLIQPKAADPEKSTTFARTNNGMIQPRFLPHGGKLYLAGGLWFEIDPRTLTERQLTLHRLPNEFESLPCHGVSTHYGLIGWNQEGAFYQISVAAKE